MPRESTFASPPGSRSSRAVKRFYQSGRAQSAYVQAARRCPPLLGDIVDAANSCQRLLSSGAVSVHRRAEQRQAAGIAERGLPFALVGFHHRAISCSSSWAMPRLSVDHLPQIVEAAPQGCPSRLLVRCRRSAVRTCKQSGNGRRCELTFRRPDRWRRDPRGAASSRRCRTDRGSSPYRWQFTPTSLLCASAHSRVQPEDRHFDFVRRAQALVAVLQPDREAGGVLHAVAAPGRADAGFHRAQGFYVGVPVSNPGLHSACQIRRQLLQSGAEKDRYAVRR